jgi:hypothetical protein
MVGVMKQHLVQIPPIKDFAAFRASREVLHLFRWHCSYSSAVIDRGFKLSAPNPKRKSHPLESTRGSRARLQIKINVVSVVSDERGEARGIRFGNRLGREGAAHAAVSVQQRELRTRRKCTGHGH